MIPSWCPTCGAFLDEVQLDEAVSARAARFVARYAALYTQYRHGARYLVRPVRDFAVAEDLCRTWSDERLERLAIFFLATDHSFAAGGSRTLGQLAALASWCDDKLREAGL